MKSKVMIFGTFDIFHPGHRSFLNQAKKYGESLIAVIARDETVLEIKKRKPMNSEKIRLDNVKKNKLADKVILGSLSDKYAAIKKYRPDVICLGYDQKFFIEELESILEKFSLEKTKIIRLKPHKPEIYKSSKLNQK